MHEVADGLSFVGRDVLLDNRLSLTARGIYAILCVEDGLGIEALRTSGAAGTEAMIKALSELRTLGYVTVGEDTP